MARMQFPTIIVGTKGELLLASVGQLIGEFRDLERVPGNAVQSSKGVQGVYTACRELLMEYTRGENLVDSRFDCCQISPTQATKLFLHGKRADDAWSSKTSEPQIW